MHFMTRTHAQLPSMCFEENSQLYSLRAARFIFKVKRVLLIDGRKYPTSFRHFYRERSDTIHPTRHHSGAVREAVAEMFPASFNSTRETPSLGKLTRRRWSLRHACTQSVRLAGAEFCSGLLGVPATPYPLHGGPSQGPTAG